MAAGIPVVGLTDHTIFKSIYFFDPNGHRLELAANTATPEMMKRLDEIWPGPGGSSGWLTCTGVAGDDGCQGEGQGTGAAWAPRTRSSSRVRNMLATYCVPSG